MYLYCIVDGCYHFSDKNIIDRIPTTKNANEVFKNMMDNDLRRRTKSKDAVIILTTPIAIARTLAHAKKSNHDGLCDCKAKANATVIKKLRKGMRYFKAMSFEILLQDKYLYPKVQLPF